jgi:tRNA G18 (ribose-2'-O)-methylase SpoU
VPFVHQPNLAQALTEAKAQKYTLVGVEITNQSKALDEYLREEAPQPTILVLGAEQSGISKEVLEVLDGCVHIPMYGRNSSLNVATALAIALSAWVSRWEQIK